MRVLENLFVGIAINMLSVAKNYIKSPVRKGGLTRVIRNRYHGELCECGTNYIGKGAPSLYR